MTGRPFLPIQELRIATPPREREVVGRATIFDGVAYRVIPSRPTALS